MRDQAPDRLDQSRIRVHEEPDPSRTPQERATSQQRVRKHTVLGMPSAKPASQPDAPAPASPPPVGSMRGPSRVSQKTMLGIPRTEIFQRPVESASSETEDVESELSSEGGTPGAAGPSPSHRVRARVRYDSADEPVPVVRRRRMALGVLALLVLLAAAWLGYRFVTVHG
jgi:hypothetical protein